GDAVPTRSRPLRPLPPPAAGPQHPRLGLLALPALPHRTGISALSAAAGAQLPGLRAGAGDGRRGSRAAPIAAPIRPKPKTIAARLTKPPKIGTSARRRRIARPARKERKRF